jgi:two-component system KDP operon response regulator KdpE
MRVIAATTEVCKYREIRRGLAYKTKKLVSFRFQQKLCGGAESTGSNGSLKIVICDDDPNQRDSIRVCLEMLGAEKNFTEFELGLDAVEHVKTENVDLIFLDMGLPDIAGVDALRELRQHTDAPVIIVSGNDTTESVAQALTIGADDYITKPFVPIELMARVEAVTRRASGRKVERKTYSIDGLLLDFDRKQASVDGQNVDLNLTEWDVLRTLLAEPGVVVEYKTLKEQAWGSTDVSDAAVHMAIRRLRQKLRQDSGAGESDTLISSHRGIGYSINRG